jgi:hypothetical protein
MHAKVATLALVSSLAAACTQPVSVESSDTGFAGSTGMAGSTGGAGFSTGVGGSGIIGTGGGVSGPTIISSNGDFTEAIVVADDPPPPVSGGTLAVISHSHFAALSDPDHDQIVMVDLDAVHLATVVPLQKGDEPGRLVEDGAGHLHVVLRGAGAVATIEPVTGAILERRAVCTHPRGIAYQSSGDLVHVACAGGQLISLPAAGGDPIRQALLDSDLRDVVVDGNSLLVTRFRAAELLVVDNGVVSRRWSPPSSKLTGSSETGVIEGINFTPAVAWRATAAAGGGVLMSFQSEQTDEVRAAAGGYGGRCGSIVRTSVALIRADGTGWTVAGIPSVIPLDLVQNPTGGIDIVAGATTTETPFASVEAVLTLSPPQNVDPTKPTDTIDVGSCSPPPAASPSVSNTQIVPVIGQAVAIAYDKAGRRLVQAREPYMLYVGDQAVTIPGDSHADTGQKIFHFATGGGLACASCHPEGREDGHLWTFAGLGPRRTQSIGGGILGTEPFHWGGDMADFSTLAHEVFGNRMSGPQLQSTHVQALANWVNQVPAMKPEPVLDQASVDRGHTLFQDPNVGCATCHVGAKLTNNATVTVGTGGPFQVPSLVAVSWRAPYLHSGCAPTLEARFGSCGGGDAHGKTSQLSTQNRADLIAFLQSL